MIYLFKQGEVNIGVVKAWSGWTWHKRMNIKPINVILNIWATVVAANLN